jgi:eukaryotic-like serine/threonine-protein kinase
MMGELLDGRYRILRLLGRGGMGAVYEAQHEGTGRRVAVKVIEGASLGDDSVRRFQREARAAGSIDTQHIVQVLDSGASPATGAPYMVMEYLEGEDLQHLLDRVRILPPEIALRIVAQVCRGLHQAHEAGVIHRDIKPANLFMARREEGEIVVKILDFGIAKFQSDQVRITNLTATGSMLGSPRYLSPEQARASRGIDRRADLWSLGVVLYRALSGHGLHEGAASVVELVMAICSDPPRPVQEVAPWLSPEVAAVLDRVLRIPPAERFPTAAAMLDAIKPLLPGGWSLREEMLVPLDATARAVIAPRLAPAAEGSTSVTARSGAVEPAPAFSVPSVTASAPRPPARFGGATIAGAAALLGLGALGAVMVTRSRPSGPDRDPAASAPAPAASAEVGAGSALVAPTPLVSAAGEAPSARPPAPAVLPSSSASAARAAPVPPRPAARRPASNGFDPTNPF